MHVLISAVGSAGDVHPFIAIGQALQRRGHEVELLASAVFAGRVARAGLGFIAVGTLEDYQRGVTNAEIWHPRRGFAAIWGEIQRQVLPSYQLIADRLRPGKTILVGSTLAAGSRLAQEKLGARGVTIHLSPICIFSAKAPARWPTLPRWSTRLPAGVWRPLQRAVERRFLDGIIAPELNRSRAQLGLPPVQRIMSHWLNSPDLVLCAWPEWFAPVQDDWPANSRTTGFPLWKQPGEAALSPELQDFLDAGPPPVAFTPGSFMAHGAAFFARAIAASRRNRQRALLVTPFRDQIPADIPAGVLHQAYVPFDHLMPRVAALVHHGGIGTSATALANAVPQLVTPFAHDQFDNATRIERLGVGRELRSGASVAAWSRALADLTSSAAVRAACLHHQKLLADPGNAAEIIAGQIESVQLRA